MRFILKSRLKEGMVLGESIKTADGKLLLDRGHVLRPNYIKRIQELSDKNILSIEESPEDLKMLSEMRSRLENELLGMIGKFSYQPRDIERSPSTFSSYRNAKEMVAEILSDPGIVSNLMELFGLDHYTFKHSLNTAAFSYLLGLSLHLYGEDLYHLLAGALLHDIGKIFVRPAILNKSGMLSRAEFEEIKAHPAAGYRFLREDYKLPEAQCLPALEHHERLDGTGYPLEKRGDEISLPGKITAIADVYDAMTADRPFRDAMLASDAMEYIMGGTGSMFDPALARLFTQSVVPFPVGTMVKLSNDVIGVVVKNYQDCCTRPRIRIVGKARGKEMLDLKNITIVQTVLPA